MGSFHEYTRAKNIKLGDFMKWFTLAIFLLSFGAQAADWQYATPIASPITTNATVALKAASNNARNYLSSMQIYNTSATVPTIVTIKDGTTVIWTGYLPLTSATLQVMPVEVTFPKPIKGSIGTALNFAVNTTGANIFISAQGYTGN